MFNIKLVTLLISLIVCAIGTGMSVYLLYIDNYSDSLILMLLLLVLTNISKNYINTAILPNLPANKPVK